jgi:hypothetical protein
MLPVSDETVAPQPPRCKPVFCYDLTGPRRRIIAYFYSFSFSHLSMSRAKDAKHAKAEPAMYVPMTNLKLAKGIMVPHQVLRATPPRFPGSAWPFSYAKYRAVCLPLRRVVLAALASLFLF